MKAIQITQFGGPEVLTLREVAAPNRQSGQLRIKTHFAGVNYIDTYQRAGITGYQKPLPLILGLEGSGEVIECDDDSDFKVGQRVAWPFSPSSYAEEVVVDQTRVVPVPDAISSDVAAAAMLQGMTAHYLVTDTFKVTKDTTALVHAAAGGVGLLLTQMISSVGGKVIATTSTKEKAELALAAGAWKVIDYQDFRSEVMSLTEGLGVDVVYDGVGVDTYMQSLESLKKRGMLVLFGASSGPVPPVDLQLLNNLGSLFVTRPSLGDYIATTDQLRYRAAEVFDSIARGELDIKIFKSYSAEDASISHQDLEARKTNGKLLLSF